MDMEMFYVLVFGVLAAAAAAFELSKPKEGQINTSMDFLRFRANYIVVYSLMMGEHLTLPVHLVFCCSKAKPILFRISLCRQVKACILV